MAYLALLWKARTIEKYRLKYEKEKINSINSTKTELRSSIYQKWTVYRNDSEKKIEQICSSCCPEGSKVANSCTFLKENSSFLLKIVIGIVGGILTYFLYKIFVDQVSVWSVIVWAVSVAIILGVVFSYRVRCLVLLLVPGLFSRVGRYTLACYALVLILTGPATNTLKNLDTLSQSLACGQEQIKSSVKEIKESKDSPLNLVKETMSGTVEKIESLAAKMKELMVVTHRLTISIAHVLQSSLSWLNSVETVCNAKLGTPYERCAQIIAQGAVTGETKFLEYSSQWDWDIIVQSACFTLKPMDPLCVVGDFAKGSIIATVKKKLRTYSDRIQSLFYMGMHIRRSHSCCSNGSLPVSQAAAGIVTDLRNRADTLLAWLSWTCALTGLFLMLIIFRAKYYLHMFRTRSRFDNRYVTKELRELDLKRQRQGRETVLPLNTRERAKYVSTASFRLLPSERMYLTRSIVFMVITTLKLMIHMVADYSLYWVLMSVRFHGTDHSSFKRISSTNRTTKIRVSGAGPLAATVRMLMEALSVPLVLPAASTTGCLPDPNPPDLQRYAQIGTLILLLWLLALFEPYGLRLRHVISGHYQPERAKARAVWLYYHIIRTRSCFLKYARRKLHRQYKYISEEKLTFKRWLHDCIPCSWLRTLLGVNPPEPHCLLCYTRHRQDDLDRHLKRCETPCCPGIYCARCFMDIGQLCTICYSPEDYGDLSDVSLEKFSSDDSDSDGFDDDDAKPLMGRHDCEIERDEKGTSSNHYKKNKRDMSLTLRNRNDNQESMPLLDGDYLKRKYTPEGETQSQCVCTNFQKQDNVSAQMIVTGLKTKKLDTKYEHRSNDVVTNNLLKESLKFKMVFRDTEVSVNGVTFPKGKLGAIIQTMMLLTTKEYDKTRNNANIKHKPFEYLVMEMFQPLEMLQRIISTRHYKSALKKPHSRIVETNERFKCSNDSPPYAKIMNNTKTLVNTDFDFKNSESMLKSIQNNFHETNKYEKISARNKKQLSTRRKVQRFLDIKKLITNNVGKSLNKSRIYCDKYKFTYKRRRRRNERYKRLRLTSMMSKVFSNKAIRNDLPLNDALDLNLEENIPVIKMSKLVKRKKNKKPDTEYLGQRVIQETECSLKHNVQNLSNTVADSPLDIRSADGRNGECPSKETDESNDIEIDANHETIEQKTQHKNNKKLGFWESLRVRRRRNHSPRIFSVSLKDDPSFYNLFANYKRRKKKNDQTKKVDHVNKVRNANNEGRSYRVGLCLKDDDLYRKMAKYNGIMDMNNELLLGRDSKGVKESERLKKEEMQNTKQELSSRWFNEAKSKKDELIARLTGEKQKDKKRDYEIRSTKEFIILYDDKGIEITPKASGKLNNLSRKLKTTISQIACNFTKRNKRGRSVAFSDVGVKDSDYNDANHWQFKVESNEELRNESHYQIIKCLNDDSSNEETESEDNMEFVRGCQKDVEDVESEVSCIEMKPHCADGLTELGLNCFHEWRVEPKKQEGCQTKGNTDEGDSSHDSSQNMIHRCFQVKIKPEKEMKGTNMSLHASMKSLDNSKRTEIIPCYCDHLPSDEGYEDSTKIRDRPCQSENICQVSQRSQVWGRNVVKDTETQCLPTYNTAVQSSEIEEENTIIPSGVSRFLRSAMKPYKGRIIKEVTERLIWPTDSTVSQVRLEYADEKTPKPKRNRGDMALTANRSTTTVTKTVADVSTITSDWWSPLLERKAMLTKMGANMQENKRTPKSKWGSSFFLDDTRGGLSPSDYLFQSEQYYNQVYSMEVSSSRASRLNKRIPESDRSTFKSYHHIRKGTKTKRLNECFSSRKKTQSSSINLAPAKWRPVVTEEQAHALKYYTRRNPKPKMNWKSRVVKQETDEEPCKDSQVVDSVFTHDGTTKTNSNMWTASIFSSSY